MNTVRVSIISAREALAKGWDLQPSFQRLTQPSKILFAAMKESAMKGVLVVPIMTRNNEVGDGRKRMLVLKSWSTWEANNDVRFRVEGLLGQNTGRGQRLRLASVRVPR